MESWSGAWHCALSGWQSRNAKIWNQPLPGARRVNTRTKTITARWPSGIKEGASLNFRPMD